MTRLAQRLPADAVQRALLESQYQGAQRTLRVCHVVSANSWTGAEVQLATDAAYLVARPDVSLTAVLLNEGPLARELRRLRVEVAIVDETRTCVLGILRFLIRFLKEHQIDLVHTHRDKDNVLGTVAAKLAGTPHVVRTVHGLREPRAAQAAQAEMTGWNNLEFRVYEALDKAASLCFADLVIAASKRMADALRESGYRPTRVTHIHNSVDLRTVTARRSPDDVRRELGIDRATLLIGTASALSPGKGHAGLLRAARLILQKEPATKFLVVGSGPHERERLASAATLRVDGVCLIPGTRTEIHDLMAAMDIFVLPSLHEGIPTAILEAMALGKPVVATAVGGAPEIVQHGVTGLLVEPGDEAALAGACLELARDRDLAQRLGAQARRLVADEFSHERCGGDLMDAYRSVTMSTLAHTDCERIARDRSTSSREQQTVSCVASPLAPRSDSATLRMVPPIRGEAGAGLAEGVESDVRFGTGRRSGTTIGALDLCRGLAQKVLDRAARVFTHAVERRRMNRIRRNPAALRRALRSAESLLVMCHGNIIRSPFATQLIRQALAGRSPVAVISAGLGAVPGNPTHPTALRAASARSVDLSGHHASPVAPDRVAASDVIFVMDLPQIIAMRERFPDACGKTFLLTSLAPELPLEIADPVNRDETAYHACYENISRAVRPIIRTLAATPTAQSPAR